MLRPEFSVARHVEPPPPIEPVCDLESRAVACADSASVAVPDALDPVVSDLLVEVCAQTGASGAALALEQEGEFYCRGAIGATAPDIGLRIDAGHGLTAECLRSGQIQICDNAERDFRVDHETCHRLGIRSFVVAPLLVDGYPSGLLALYSPIVRAFGSQDLQRLGVLARRLVTVLSRPQPRPWAAEEAAPAEVRQDVPPETASAEAIVPTVEELATAPVEITDAAPESPAEPVVANPVAAEPELIAVETLPEAELTAATELPQLAPALETPERNPWTNRLLALTVVAAAVLLGWMSSISYHLRSVDEVTQATTPAATPAPVPAAVKFQATDPQPVQSNPAAKPPLVPASQNSRATGPSAPGELVVYEKNRVVFRMRSTPIPPPASRTGAMASAASVSPSTSPAVPVENPVADLVASKPATQPAGQNVSHTRSPGLTGGQIVYRVPPVAPAQASQLGLEGDVVLQVIIAKDGVLGAIRPLSGDPRLIPSAVDAVRQWRYQPFLQDGNPVEVQGKITIHFGKTQ